MSLGHFSVPGASLVSRSVSSTTSKLHGEKANTPFARAVDKTCQLTYLTNNLAYSEERFFVPNAFLAENIDRGLWLVVVCTLLR